MVRFGERVNADQIIADGPSTEMGEIALGKNILIAFMTWEGYNYEDAMLINEKLVMEDVLTSVHIEEYESEARDTKLGPEEITRDIPNVGEEMLKDLDERGIIRIGAEVKSGDILVGKVTPKGETELTAEERLLRAIFGEKARDVKDTSLRLPGGEGGKVVDIQIFTRDNGDELATGVIKQIKVNVAQTRKISVGDKIAGRHGNKGVISIIVPEEEYDINEVVRKVKEGYESGAKTHHVIVVAEGVMGAEEFAAKMKEAGDTSDLRATNIGHVVRGGSPTARDRVLASWMGAHAVDLLKQGIGGVAVGIHNEELVESPILGTAEEGALFSLTEDGKIIVNNPHKARLDFADLNRSLSNLS